MSNYQIIQYQWLQSEFCQGSPNIMYSINVQTLYDRQPSINQTWPGLFEMQMRELPYGVCGVAALPVKDECCTQSLDMSHQFSNGYKSGRPSLVSDLMLQMPLDSNGYSYCNITDSQHLSISGYNFVAFLSDDTQCMDNYYRCFSNSSFSVYEKENCQAHHFTYFFIRRVSFPYNTTGKQAQNFTFFVSASLSNLGTLVSTYHTLSVMHLLNPTRKLNRVIQYIMMTVLHVVLAGGYLFGRCLKLDNQFPFCIPFSIAKIWVRTHFMWILCVFICNLIPPIAITVKVTRAINRGQTIFQCWQRIYIADQRMVKLIVFQIFLAAIYWVLGILAVSSNIFGDSYVMNTALTASVSILAIHSVLNAMLLERLIKTIKLLGCSKQNTELKTNPENSTPSSIRTNKM
ncbi:hypothetical protein BC833DRAFT_254750 [Globomyces pollinis-pini]|nr:hypothetical protein BC833DRAFT_254750 [Globomyces pollinis-pini]